MKSAAVVLGLSSAFILALTTHRSVASDSPAHSSDGYWECRNGPIEQTAYFSAIFEANADLDEIARSYEQMLAAKYGYQGRAYCGVATDKTPATLAKLKDDQARYVNQLRQSQIKVFLTGWVYPGALAAAPAQAPANAPAAAPQANFPTSFYICIAMWKGVAYESAVFERSADGRTPLRLNSHYALFLGEKYGIAARGICTAKPTPAAAEAYLRDFPAGVAGGVSKHVATGWADPKGAPAAPP